jgi:hypothetical protein
VGKKGNPMDIPCRICGEPYDSYGITYDVGRGDLDPYEVSLFRKGKGCPCCNFGKTCPSCGGTGKAGSRCDTCSGTRRVFVQRSPDSKETKYQGWGIWAQGKVRPTTEPFRKLPNKFYREGSVECGLALCPDCGREDHGKCPSCKGSGKPQNKRDAADFLESLSEASDEDPIAILNYFHS